MSFYSIIEGLDDKKFLKLQQVDRRKLGKEFSVEKFGTYYDEIPLDKIEKILNQYGCILLQEDGTRWSGFMCGASGHCSIEIGYTESMFMMNGMKAYIPFDNAMLCLAWYKVDNSRYEITLYVS